ncbi:hypothetical protein ACS780_20620 [Yersinia enterocolitica]|uniref:hypothetical protein n=1 Tax=Yersinia enterocolitica TaxID=630 RepID=UPI003F47F112
MSHSFSFRWWLYVSTKLFSAYFVIASMNISTAHAELAGLYKDKYVCISSSLNSLEICKSQPIGFNYRMLSVNAPYYASKTLVTDSSIRGDKETNIYNYVQNPPEDKDYGSYVFSFLAIIISIGIPVWQRYVQKNDAINEGFWIREVVMPKINANIFAVCAAFRNNLTLSESDFSRAYNDELLPQLNELRDSFSLLTAFPKAVDCSTVLNGYCDDFEDVITNNINKPVNVRKEDISYFHLKLTKELISIHQKIS